MPSDAIAALGDARLGLTLPPALQAAVLGDAGLARQRPRAAGRIRRVKPLRCLARRDEGGRRQRRARRLGARFDTVQALTAVVVLRLFASLAGWQAGSWRVGAFVSAGFVVVAIALLGAGAAVRPRWCSRWRASRWFPLRHAVIGLGRPGNQTRVILLAVGLGCFFILGVALVERTLCGEFSLDLRPDAPDLFFARRAARAADRRPGVPRAAARGAGRRACCRCCGPASSASAAATSTSTRSRTSASAAAWRASSRSPSATTWSRTRACVEGAFWNAPTTGEPEVSIEEGMRERAGLHVGDTMRFDILGRVDRRREVTSVREVDWRRLAQRRLHVRVPARAARRRRRTTISASRAGPTAPAARARLQRDLVDALPNVSVIDVREVLETIRDVIVARSTLGIRVVGGRGAVLRPD